MKKIYIQNGRVIDPSVQLDRKADLVIGDGVIEGIYDCGAVVPEPGIVMQRMSEAGMPSDA